jgi:hypothetical protein
MNRFDDYSFFDYVFVGILVVVILLGCFGMIAPFLPQDFLTTLINKINQK